MSLSFTHPGLALATVGLMTVPAIIHLLARRRFKTQRWAAMTFLLAAHRESRRRMQIEQWLLLVVRTLAVAAVGFTVARPALSDSALARAVGEPHLDRVLIFDDSLSMNAKSANGTSAFDTARRIATKLLDAFAKQDGVAVVLTSGRAVVDRPTIDHESVRRIIAELACGAGRADLTRALTTARHILARGDAPADCKAVYILTDAGRSTWRRPPGDGADLLPAALTAAAGPARRYLIDVGRGAVSNVAVTGLGVAEHWIPPGTSVVVDIELSSFAGPQARTVQLDLLLDGTSIRHVPVSLPAAGVRRLQSSLRIDRPGPHVITARILNAGDGLSIDDDRCLIVNAAGETPILVVSGHSGSAAADDAAFYFDGALGAAARATDAAPLFAVKRIEADELDTTVLGNEQVIVLLDVPRLSAAQWMRLNEFVRAGGGLVVGLGAHVVSASYNDVAGPDADGSAAGLLPVVLGDTVSHERDALRLHATDARHPVIREVMSHIGGGLLTAAHTGHVRLNASHKLGATPPRAILTFENAEPALLEAHVGRGRVFVWAGSFDMTWSTLPARPDFVPFVMNLVAAAAGEGATRTNLRVDEPWRTSIPMASATAAWMVRRPDGIEEVVTPREATDSTAGARRWSVEYDAVNWPGVFTAAAGDERRLFAATTDPAESDPTVMSEYDLRERLGAAFTFVKEADEFARQRVVAPQRELAGTLTGALFAFVLAETLLAMWFGHHHG